MNNSRYKPRQHKDNNITLTTQPPIPTSSSYSSTTTQNDDVEDTSTQEHHHEEEDFYYISNQVRDYHSLFLQASDALSEDSNACPEHCYYLLSSPDVPRIVRCGALYLLASCSEPDSQEANDYLEKALTLCDDMDEVNEREGVTDKMVPNERVVAMREQLLKLKSVDDSNTISSQAMVLRRATPPPTNPTTTRDTSPVYAKKRVRLITPPITIENETKANSDITIESKTNAGTDSDSSSTSFTTAPLGNDSSEEMKVPKGDRCHIAELEFELSCARDEETRARRRVVAARKKREGIEEKLKKMRRLRELQKM